MTSRVVLGCTSTTPHSYPDSPRRAEMVDVLRGALEAGVDTFDTSEIQGPFTGEELLGEALGGRGTVVTKFGWEIEDGTPTGRLNSRPEVIRASAEGSLRRLGRDQLDVYLQHRVDPQVPIEEVAGTVGELIQEGKVARFGLCEAAPDTIRRAHAECPLSVIQHEYSLWTRGPETTVLSVARELGLDFMAYSPLGKGFLAGSAQPNDDSSSPRLHTENFAANQQLAKALFALAEEWGMTPAQLALGWLLAQGTDIYPVAGSTNLARIRANAAAQPLDPAQVEAVDTAVAAHPVAGARYTDKHLSFMDAGLEN